MPPEFERSKNRRHSRRQKKSPKFIFVSGGVISGLGKGVTTASISLLLKSYGYRVAPIKCDAYFTIRPDGSVWPCDNFIGAGDFCFGNLNSQPLVEIITGGSQRLFAEQINSRKTACSSCEWNGVCNGGCSWRAYQATLLGYPLGHYYCNANRIIFKHVEQHLKSVVDEYKRPERK